MFRERSESGPITSATRQLVELQERIELQSRVVEALIFCLKEFTFDLVEIGANKFKKDLDELAEQVRSADSPKTIQKAFDSRKESILSFIGVEQKYFGDKEQELKAIIDMLRENLSTLLGSNREFATSVYESNLRMEEASQLDDIRRIKERLKSELSYVKQSVQEKQRRDTSMLESLAKEVDSLRSCLEKAKDDSMSDPLTGAGNRMALDMALNYQFDRNKLSFRRFSVLMCDLDHFKRFNDCYGHQIGDLVLRAFVRECKELARDEDFLGRYGGEEFVIILPGANLNDATKRAEKIRSTIASRVYTANRSTTAEPFSFTVSIGVCEARKDDSYEDVLHRSDQALYIAKDLGRNKVATERQIRPNAARRAA